MNILSRESQNICTKHSDQYLQFIHTQQVQNIQGQARYLCEMCLSEDISFSSTEIISIKHIIEQGEKNIVHKWPPVNNYQLLTDLIQKTKENRNKQSIETKIVDFFTELKQEVLKQIDIYQKKIINQVTDLSTDHEHIIEEYRKISKIDQLRSILIDNNQNNMRKIEDLSKLINQLQSEKDQNTTLLRDIIQRYSLLESKFKQENLNSFKNYILTFIKTLNFFGVENKQQSNKSESLSSENKILSTQIMKLISNKTNYCSSEFLNKMSEQLTLLEPILEQLQVGNICEREPIKFDLIENEELELIEQQVDHLIKLNSSEEYKNEIQNSELIQFTLKHNKKMKFGASSFDTQYNNYLVKTYPFVRNTIDLQQQTVVLPEYSFSEEFKSNNLRLKSPTILINESKERLRFGLINPKIDKSKIIRFQFKISKKSDWIGIGICFVNSIKYQNFKFQYDKIGNGYYMVSENGYSWSHSNQTQHYVNKAFNFGTGDSVFIEFNPDEKKLKFYNKSSDRKYQMDIEIPENDDIMPCVCLCENDEIEIINNSTEILQIDFD